MPLQRTYERKTYEKSRSTFLALYRIYCRRKIRFNKDWIKDEHELGYALYEHENGLELPVEKLIVLVLGLLLNANKLRTAKENILKEINNLFDQHNLSDLLDLLPAPECHDLVTDLHLLGIPLPPIYAVKIKEELADKKISADTKPTTYWDMGLSFFKSYEVYCKNKIRHNLSWEEDEHEIHFAYAQNKDKFDTPLEQLMVEVWALILSGNRFKDKAQQHYDKIDMTLKDYDADMHIAMVPDKDKLIRDMQLLKIYPS